MPLFLRDPIEVIALCIVSRGEAKGVLRTFAVF